MSEFLPRAASVIAPATMSSDGEFESEDADAELRSGADGYEPGVGDEDESGDLGGTWTQRATATGRRSMDSFSPFASGDEGL